MSLLDKIVNLGKLTVIIYDFEEIDDVLPMHEHGKDDIHITIVARGSFRCHGAGWESKILAGDVLDWEVGQFHEFIALEPNSRLVNVQK
jgi:hypothetical protein